MENFFKMSLFMPPISPIKDQATGKVTKPASLVPLQTVDLTQVYQLITANERLARLTDDIRRAAERNDSDAVRLMKQQTLPYVTPCGIFSRRRSDCLREASGLVVVDIDHLESAEEAGLLRQQLFDDPYLQPLLVFVSPTGRGVKAFVPYAAGQDASDAVCRAMDYVHCMYGTDAPRSGKGVDTSGKDIVRSCFLCHDEKALMRR
ncbi:BT4734/BF3469 family protein [uncultured Bacteroides sp.]|uniref:BT4734/BF3469 family protein n=1 Tax=uncultured Bacteroides sp. TaxID=162156 RepID=UPI00280AE000|nr:BT4734/BF3469 family protein [uncultured Bacteroides sp.]